MYHFSAKLRHFVAAAAFAALAAPTASATSQTGLGSDSAGLGAHSTALKVALAAPNAAGDDARLHYESRAYTGLWLKPDGDASRAEALLDALDAAPDHALPGVKYPSIELRAAVARAASGDPAAVAAAELALTRAYLAYARDVSSGVLEPRSVDRELHVFPERPEQGFLLDRIARVEDVQTFLQSLAPNHPHYEPLRAKLAELSLVASASWGEPVAGGGSIRPGAVGQRVAQIRARLSALGDHQEAGGVEDPRVYDPSLVESVKAFQRRHGLNDDGVAGARTIKALNAGVEQRIGQIVVNLERIRWLNRDLGHRHILVNQADFTVKLVEGDDVLFQERVVVGKARRHRTPEFSDQMTHLVFNPTWHVPRSIASEEILPKLQEDPFYLQKKNMRLVAPGGEAPDPLLTDWSLYSASDFPYRVKQRPGGGNALGRVKFMFPNQFSIYLHDTPSKRLFAKDARAFSHGCVRVQNPMELANLLVSAQRDDAASFIDRVLARGREATVNLDDPVQVHLTYRTAWVDEAGVEQYRDDIYGRDARILSALRAAGVEAAAGG